MDKSKINDVPEFFQNYIKLVPEGNLLNLYKEQTCNLIDFYSTITETKSFYKYEKEKWSLKELVGHLCDTERIFSYRALRIIRDDKTPLAGYDENKYVTAANFDQHLFLDLLKQYGNIRNSNSDLFSSFNEIDFDKDGIIEGNNLCASSIIAILIGHAEHHKNIVLKRYL